MVSKRNRTIKLTEEELGFFSSRVFEKVPIPSIINSTINSDILKIASDLPSNFVDLLFLDPPYNLSKVFNQTSSFKKTGESEYAEWLEKVIVAIRHTLKSTASIYICGDWFSSVSIYRVVSKFFKVRNRITWEREKGRGAKRNWKNSSEDIWFCTNSDIYFFNVEAVKLKKKVIAPYKSEKGVNKDWVSEETGNFRLTYPSNIWTDLTVPFWSMAENTEHPTQKPEKLLAKIILASSRPGDTVFDPFLGSGTTSVAAKKLNRNYVGIEIDRTFCAIAEKRIYLSSTSTSIQGYENGIFFERNSK